MKPEVSFQRSQQLFTELNKYNPRFCPLIFLLTYRPCKWSVCSSFPHQILYKFLFFPIYPTYLAEIALIDFITTSVTPLSEIFSSILLLSPCLAQVSFSAFCPPTLPYYVLPLRGDFIFHIPLKQTAKLFSMYFDLYVFMSKGRQNILNQIVTGIP
jgi:hypothetical protein